MRLDSESPQETATVNVVDASVGASSYVLFKKGGQSGKAILLGTSTACVTSFKEYVFTFPGSINLRIHIASRAACATPVISHLPERSYVLFGSLTTVQQSFAFVFESKFQLEPKHWIFGVSLQIKGEHHWFPPSFWGDVKRENRFPPVVLGNRTGEMWRVIALNVQLETLARSMFGDVRELFVGKCGKALPSHISPQHGLVSCEDQHGPCFCSDTFPKDLLHAAFLVSKMQLVAKGCMLNLSAFSLQFT